MAREAGELEMRVGGLDKGGGAGAVKAALAGLDPGAGVRVDPTTGIVHITTACDTIEVEEALTRAGFDVTASTG